MIQEDGLVAHYTKECNLDKILSEGKILLSPVENMDDPRECSLGWIDTVGIGNKIDKDGWETAEEIKNNVGKKLRIFCTAQPKPENKHSKSAIENSIYCRPRMWSQYGNKFKGFCILFDKNKLISAIDTVEKENDYLIHDSVYYPNWLEFVQGGVTIEFGSNISTEEKEPLDLINKNEMLHSIYFKKGFDWKEEYEYRWLFYSHRPGKIIVDVKSAIHTIVLGDKFPTDMYERVKKYCKGLNCKCYSLNYRHPEYNLIKFG